MESGVAFTLIAERGTRDELLAAVERI